MGPRDSERDERDQETTRVKRERPRDKMPLYNHFSNNSSIP